MRAYTAVKDILVKVDIRDKDPFTYLQKVIICSYFNNMHLKTPNWKHLDATDVQLDMRAVQIKMPRANGLNGYKMKAILINGVVRHVKG